MATPWVNDVNRKPSGENDEKGEIIVSNGMEQYHYL